MKKREEENKPNQLKKRYVVKRFNNQTSFLISLVSCLWWNEGVAQKKKK